MKVIVRVISARKLLKKYRDTHKKIRNGNESSNSLNFAKVSTYALTIECLDISQVRLTTILQNFLGLAE